MLVAAGICALLFFRSRPTEPSYAGHSLSYWLRKANHPNPSISAQGEEAIRSIGTNALPTVIRWLSERDSQWKIDYNGQVLALFRYDWDRADSFLLGRRSWKAAEALRIIGPNAKAAIPALIQNMTNHPGSSSSPSCYALALEQIGTDALLPLTKALVNPDQNVRNYAADALSYFDTNVVLVLPELINLLNSSSESVQRVRLAGVIGKARGDGRAVKALLAMLRATPPDERWRAAYCLGYMGSAGKAALPELIPMLQTDDTNLQELVRFAITSIDTNLVVMGNRVSLGTETNIAK